MGDDHPQDGQPVKLCFKQFCPKRFNFVAADAAVDNGPSLLAFDTVAQNLVRRAVACGAIVSLEQAPWLSRAQAACRQMDIAIDVQEGSYCESLRTFRRYSRHHKLH